MTKFSEKNRTRKFILRLRPDELAALQVEADRVAHLEGSPCNRSAILRRATDCYFAQQARIETRRRRLRLKDAAGTHAGRRR